MTKIHQTFRIDPSLLSKAKKQATKENRKPCNLYETAIHDYLEMKSNSIELEKLKTENSDLKSQIKALQNAIRWKK